MLKTEDQHWWSVNNCCPFFSPTVSFTQVTDLKENKFYQFQVRAFNQAGISEGSKPTAPLECKEWTVAVPGKPVSIYIRQ